MADALTLRRTDPDHESYATLYEHPEFGKIDVGRISERSGNPNGTDAWSWCIRITTLAPVYSDDDTSVPSAERKWITREAVSFEGTAPTRKAAIAAWKAHWPRFRDARTEAEWHDAKAEQDYGEKKQMITDARALQLTAEQRAELQRELGRPGPAPHWLRSLLARAKDK